MLLRMSSRFVDRKVDIRDNRLPQYKIDIKVDENEINNHNLIRGLREKMNPIDETSNFR